MTTRPMTRTPGSATRRRRVPLPITVFSCLVAGYLVVRAGIEFVTIDYGNPAGYQQDWGGPSLVGVLAVHTGPGIAVVGYAVTRWLRPRSRVAR